VIRDVLNCRVAGALFRRGKFTGRAAREIFRATVINAPHAKIPDRERRASVMRRGAQWRGY
jgi:hypothetical protein